MLERATTACEDWDALGTQQRMLQHLTPEGTVDWKTVLSPEVAREVSRHDIAGIWVTSFSRWQRCRC